MAMSKRKANLQAEGGTRRKKVKKEEYAVPVRSQIAETEEDSEPIVESDTTSQSGDDDGESWPSDEDVGDDDAFSGFEEEDIEDVSARNGTKRHGQSSADAIPKLDQHSGNGVTVGDEGKRGDEEIEGDGNADAISTAKKDCTANSFLRYRMLT